MDGKPAAMLKPMDLKHRTRTYAVRVIRVYSALPKTAEAQTIGRQMLRSGTSVVANYREGIRARSRAEYATKLNISLMELEETLYWFELLEAANIMPSDRLGAIKDETAQLSAILVTLIKKAKRRQK
jgi:four helix bundle protein